MLILCMWYISIIVADLFTKNMYYQHVSLAQYDKIFKTMKMMSCILHAGLVLTMKDITKYSLVLTCFSLIKSFPSVIKSMVSIRWLKCKISCWLCKQTGMKIC